MRITARIFNAGLFPARDVPVRLVLDGKSPLEQKVTVEGRTRALVQFDVPINEPALHSGFVEVQGGDELPFDDRRYHRFRDATAGTNLARRRRARPVGLRQ